MKKLKLMLTTLSMLVALSGIFAPVQVVRADGPQGTSDSQRTSTTSSNQDAALAFWLWLFRLLALIL